MVLPLEGTHMSGWQKAIVAAAAAGLVSLPMGARADHDGDHGNAQAWRITYDDFQGGFAPGTPGSKWFYFSAGPFVGNDGIESTDRHGLHVVSKGTNPYTGEPAFTSTVAPDSQSGIPGGIDHVKWLVYTTHQASSGYPGFDAVPGRTIACESWIGGETYGTEFEPFGSAVDDPQDDLRLAAFAQNSIDFETFMVFDWFITNKHIYAFYERLPFGRGIQGNPADYAAFSSYKAVAEYHPGEKHHLKTELDKSAGEVRWYVDGNLVMKIDHIGHRPPRDMMTLDHGGVEQDVSPRQLDCGMGTFTLLDAYRPTNIGLVELSDTPNMYFNPDVGQPTPEPFVDTESLQKNRIFGQGARIDVKRYAVSSGPSSVK